MEGIKRRRLGERAWREVLARHAGGGESVSAFCRREGLSPNSFRRWRERLAPSALGAAPRKAVPVSSAPAAHGFVDLGVLGGAAAPGAGRLEVHLELGGGITLHLVRG
jgi:hypothetical protein